MVCFYLQEIGVGMYDVLDMDADQKVEEMLASNMVPQSTEQIVKV